MKKQIASLIVCSLTILFLLPACQKDDNNNPPTPKTKTQLISQSSWKFSTATVSGANASGYLQACQKDNIYTFVAAGTGTIDEGPSKCNSGDAQTNPFTWNFASSENMLHISTVLFTGGSNDFTLVSLTETELIASQNYPPYGTIVVTFVH
jgi:Lipocalin-like domain